MFLSVLTSRYLLHVVLAQGILDPERLSVLPHRTGREGGEGVREATSELLIFLTADSGGCMYSSLNIPRPHKAL